MAKKSDAEKMLNQAESAVTARELMDKVSSVRTELEQNLQDIVSGGWQSKPKPRVKTGTASEILAEAPTFPVPTQQVPESPEASAVLELAPPPGVTAEGAAETEPPDDIEFDTKLTDKVKKDIVWDIPEPKAPPQTKKKPVDQSIVDSYTSQKPPVSDAPPSRSRRFAKRKPNAGAFKEHYPKWLSDMKDGSGTINVNKDVTKAIKSVASMAVPFLIGAFILTNILPSRYGGFICPLAIVILFIIGLNKLKNAGIFNGSK